MTKTIRATSIILCFLTLFTVFSATTMASATQGNRYYCVVTKSNYWYPGSESITVSQSKETYYSNKSHTKTKSRNSLVCTVKCTPISWSSKKQPATITKTFTGSSKKINLEKNVTYSVEISWKSVICANHYGTKKEGYAYISKLHKAQIK